MPTIDQATLDRWRALAIVDRDGGTVGSIVEFYLDRGTGHPTWALVNIGLFGSRHTFVPLLHATEISDGLKVPYEKGHIKDAPRIDATGELSPEDEATLLQHYGIDDGTAGEPPPADPGLAEPLDADVAEPGTTTADAGVTTEEERAAGGPEAVAAGPGPVPAADQTATWPPSPPPPGPLTEPPVELRPEGVGEAPPAREEAATEATGPDRAGLRDDELTAERGRPEGAAAPEEEPSMLERAKRRLEGLVSGTGPADREAADADRPDERPGVDRDRR